MDNRNEIIRKISDKLANLSMTYKNVIRTKLNIVQNHLYNSELDRPRMRATVVKRYIDKLSYRSYKFPKDRSEFSKSHWNEIVEGESFDLPLYHEPIVFEQIDELISEHVKPNGVYEVSVVISWNSHHGSWDGCAYLIEIS